MGLFDRKTKQKTQTVDFVHKRVEMSSLFSTYIEYLNDTEEHNKGDFEIYHWEQADRKSRPYITIRYDASSKTGSIFFDDQFEFECGEMVVDTKTRTYQLALVEPNVVIHKFGVKKVNNKAMIRYISILNSINTTKVKPSLFYDINNLEDAQKPVEFTYCSLSNTAKPGDLFAEALSASGDKYEYYITEIGVKAVNKAHKLESEAKAKEEAEARAKAEVQAAVAKAEAEKAKAEAEKARIEGERKKAEAEAKAKAEAEAKAKAEKEAFNKAHAAEIAKAEAEARAKAEVEQSTEEAKKAAAEAKKAQQEAAKKARAEAAARKKAEQEAAEAKAQAEALQAQADNAVEKARKELAKDQMKSMLKDGMPVKLVAKYTGFTEAEVQKVYDVLTLLGEL